METVEALGHPERQKLSGLAESYLKLKKVAKT
jgi:hypothetical protein